MNKMKWFSCISCEYLDECSAGKARITELPENSKVAGDIGCFNQEIFHNSKNQQLSLLKFDEDL